MSCLAAAARRTVAPTASDVKRLWRIDWAAAGGESLEMVARVQPRVTKEKKPFPVSVLVPLLVTMLTTPPDGLSKLGGEGIGEHLEFADGLLA